MGISRTLATAEEREQRAALRDSILEYGRLLGWPGRAAIALTERLSRRPWKRCSRAELSAVREQFLAILRAFEARNHTPSRDGAEIPPRRWYRRGHRARRR